MRVALDQGSFTALQADSVVARSLIAGILLLIPGFITDLLALLLLLPSLQRAAAVVVDAVAASASQMAWSILHPNNGIRSRIRPGLNDPMTEPALRRRPL